MATEWLAFELSSFSSCASSYEYALSLVTQSVAFPFIIALILNRPRTTALLLLWLFTRLRPSPLALLSIVHRSQGQVRLLARSQRRY